MERWGGVESLLPSAGRKLPYLFLAAGFLAAGFLAAGFLATDFAVFFTVFFTATVSPLIS